VLVFNLNADNSFPDHTPDYVLGQPDFSSNTSIASQSGMYAPDGLAYDLTNNRLFVADSSNNRVLVFNATTISSGMNATYVIGQPDFVTNSSAASQSKMSSPDGIAYDSANNRLFVAEYFNNRVTIFNTSTISNGMNALYELGQTNYTNSAIGSTSSRMNGPVDVNIDTTTNRLFVADANNSRVLVFNTTSLSNGMAASNVIGQTGFSLSTAATSQSRLNGPHGVSYDSSNSRLFVTDRFNHRVLVFNTNNVTNGMNATSVIGQADFVSGGDAVTQSNLNQPWRITYNTTTQQLYVGLPSQNRVLIFNQPMISSGNNATDLLGQYNSASATTTILQTKAGTNNTPHERAFLDPSGAAIDTVNHRLFIADSGNNRVLVFNLNNSNALLDRTADYVLGQTNFTNSSAGLTQAGMSAPRSVAFDSTGNRLFVSDSSYNRVLVFSTSTITNGMNATSVLGQANFTTSTAATTQAGMSNPRELALDTTNNKLFVADTTNNRVLVYSTSSISNGMNASNVLGQSLYTTATAATTQSGLSAPRGLAFDASNSRIFVAEQTNNRVLVFSTSSITNGMNAANVIGQANFTSAVTATTQSGLSAPYGLIYDNSGSRLFVSDPGNNRLLVFSTSSITDGMNANGVVGQANFTTNTAATSQTGLSAPHCLAYDAGNRYIWLVDNANNRIVKFDAGL